MLTQLVKFLRWSERYTKTDMVYLATGGFWLTTAQIAAAVASFGLAIVFANLLPRETFGAYKYVLSLFAILEIPTLDDMDTAVRRAAARGKNGALVAGLRAKVRWGTLGSVGAFAVAGYYFLQGNAELAISFAICAAFLPFVDTFTLYFGYLEGKQLFKESAVQRTGIQIVSVLALVVTMYLTTSLPWILVAYFLPYTVLRVVGHYYTVRRDRILATQDDDETVRYGFHLSVIGTLNAVVGENLNRILIWHIVGPAAVAVYSLAFSPVVQMRMLFNNLFALGLPKFAARPLGEIKRGAVSKMLRLFAIVVLMVVAYIIAAPFLFRIFFPQYLDAVFYSQLLSTLLLFTPKNVINLIMLAHAHQRDLYIWNSITAVIQICTLVPLLWYFGITGVIASIILTQVAATVVLFYQFWQMSDL